MRPSHARPAHALLVPVLLAASTGCVPDASTPSLRDQVESRIIELEQTIPALLDSGAVSGLSIAVASDSGIVWSRGFGVRNADTGEPVDANTVFEAASLSKPVFAYAVLQLVDDGLIDLDTPLYQYFEYEDIAHDERYKQITARIVLTHSAGFPNWRPRGGRLTIGFEPGTEFSYSGEGFGYLQRAVMQLTGQPLQEMMEERVFEPLGMTRSGYIWDDRFDANLALPHRSTGEVLEKRKPGPGQGHAAATLHTTAADFARFLTAALNGTELSDSMAVAMLTPQIAVDSGVTWGLGIGLQDNEQGRGFWHWGDNTGYKAYTIAYPEHGLAMVWFSNSENGHLILEALLQATVAGEHPAVAWLDYDQYDSPSRQVRKTLRQTIDEQGVEAAIARYQELKESEPPEAFDEYTLNALGYELLRSDRIDDAIAIFRLNIEEYPDAWNPYDSLGEAYMVAGELELAIEYYERSIELNPENTNGIAILERLRAQLEGEG